LASVLLATCPRACPVCKTLVHLDLFPHIHNHTTTQTHTQTPTVHCRTCFHAHSHVHNFHCYLASLWCNGRSNCTRLWIPRSKGTRRSTIGDEARVEVIGHAALNDRESTRSSCCSQAGVAGVRTAPATSPRKQHNYRATRASPPAPPPQGGVQSSEIVACVRERTAVGGGLWFQCT
jgi:hypothetical protein